MEENEVQETAASEVSEPTTAEPEVVDGASNDDSDVLAIAELFDSPSADTDSATGEDETPEAVEQTEESAEAKQPEEKSVEDELRAQIVELTAKMQELGARVDTAKVEISEPVLQLPESPKEVTAVDFLGGEDPADFLTDPAKFNHILNVVATVAARSAVASAKESTLRAIPEIVQRSAHQQSEIDRSVDSFYAANPDLVPFKNMVSMAATQVFSGDPSMKLEDILNSAAGRVRDVLKLRKTQVNVRPAQPVAAGTAGAKRPVPLNLTTEEMQIAELFG